MRTFARLLVSTAFLALPAVAAAESHLPVTVEADAHGGHVLTEMEVIRGLVPTDDPKAPAVGDKMTPELLRYLVGRMNVMDPSDIGFVLKPIAEMNFTEAREPVLEFMAKHKAHGNYLDEALRAIGKPEDAVALARAAAAPQGKWPDMQTGRLIEALAGEDAALWREIATVDDPYFKGLAAQHLLANPKTPVDELVALYRAGSRTVRTTILETLQKKSRPDAFSLLLVAAGDPNPGLPAMALECLKGYTPADDERQAAVKAAEALYATGVMEPRLAGARLAAWAGDPRGFDWALACIQDYNDSGQPKTAIDTGVMMGPPGDGARVFEAYDRPGLANFLRLVKKGEKAAALRDVAHALAPRDEHIHIVTPIAPQSEEGAALARDLATVGTDLAKELAATILPPSPALARLGPEMRPVAQAQKVTEKDFAIVLGRRPFSKLGEVEFRLKKVTPGKVVCQGGGFTLVAAADAAGARHMVMGGGLVNRGFGLFDQSDTVCTNSPAERALAGGVAPIHVAFDVQLPEGPPLRIKADFKAEQLLIDESGDVAEYVRWLNSGDPSEYYKALDLFGGRGAQPYEPAPLSPEAREAVRAALMEKLHAMAFAEAPEDYNSLYFGGEHSWNVMGLARCMTALETLGPDKIDDAWFEALFDGRSYLAANWGWQRLRTRWGDSMRDWPAVDAKLLKLTQDRLASDKPYTVRNAVLLLTDMLKGRRTHPVDLDQAVGRLAGHESPMVRAAVATLVAECAWVLDPEVLFRLAEDKDKTVARTALAALSPFVDKYITPRHPVDAKKVLTLYERVLAGDDKDLAEAVRKALSGVGRPEFVPVLYRLATLRPALRGEDKGGYLSFPLDSAATAFLLDRLAADPSDRVAVGYLVTGGYVWPPDSRPGRLQKLVRETLGESKYVDLFLQGAVVRLLTADKDDGKAAAALAEALRTDLRAGNRGRTGQDCLALAALGRKTDAPLEKVLLADDYPEAQMHQAAVLALYATDREAARAPLLSLLREVSREHSKGLAALGRQTAWPDVRKLAEDLGRQPGP
jgi:hypothetical protein